MFGEAYAEACEELLLLIQADSINSFNNTRSATFLRKKKSDLILYIFKAFTV